MDGRLCWWVVGCMVDGLVDGCMVDELVGGLDTVVNNAMCSHRFDILLL